MKNFLQAVTKNIKDRVKLAETWDDLFTIAFLHAKSIF